MKWEYKKVYLSSSKFDEDFLNKLGNEGWELVFVDIIREIPLDYVTLIFKRPKK